MSAFDGPYIENDYFSELFPDYLLRNTQWRITVSFGEPVMSHFVSSVVNQFFHLVCSNFGLIREDHGFGCRKTNMQSDSFTNDYGKNEAC